MPSLTSYTPKYGGWTRGAGPIPFPRQGLPGGATSSVPGGGQSSGGPPSGDGVRQWGAYGTTRRFDPATGQSYVEALPDPPDPRITEEERVRSRDVRGLGEDRTNTLSSAQQAANVARGSNADWSVTGGGMTLSGGPDDWDERAARAETRRRLMEELGRIEREPRVAREVFGDEHAARAAAFARAKDQASMTARASLNALYDSMASSGQAGSPLEAGLATGVAQRGQGMLGEISRDQALSDAERAADIANRTYQGNITQRGQDMDTRRSLLALLQGLA